MRIGEIDVLGLDARQLRALRGDRSPTSRRARRRPSTRRARSSTRWSSLPALHGRLRRAEAEPKAIALFRELALPEPETIGARYPHQVSGGQLQRLMAAMALITDPELVILDEPTTALDVTTQIEVLRAFRRVVRERQVTAVYVSHDLAVVAQMADHILVLRDGEMRELKSTERAARRAAKTNTRRACSPRRARWCAAQAEAGGERRPAARGARPVGRATARAARTAGRAKMIVEDIDLQLKRGQAIGVIGESGSGKTTLARAMAGLLAPCAGTMAFARPGAEADARASAAATSCAASRSSSSRPTPR